MTRPPELSESQAQDLLRQAADTIDVDPAGPLDTSLAPRRRWPVLAAAAAVALIVGGAVLAIPENRTPAPVAPPPPITSTPPAASTTVPGVFGLRTAEATALLSRLGFDPEVRVQSCRGAFVAPYDAAISTRPYPGTEIPPGAAVTVLVSDGCPSATLSIPLFVGWGLVDLARNGDSHPRFAPQVDLRLGETSLTTITAAEAADPTNWSVCAGDDCRSALAEIDRTASMPVIMNDAPYEQNPYLAYVEAGPDSWRYDIQVPMDEIDPVDLITVTLDDQNRIAAVVLTTPPPASAAPANPAASATADQFVQFARGGTPPAFDPAVDVFVNDDYRDTLRDGDLDRRTAWRVDCRDESFCLPPPSVLRVIATSHGTVAQSSTPSPCPAHPAASSFTTGLYGLDGLTLVRLSEPEPSSCRSEWAVELYLDADRRIAAVNLLLGADYAPIG